ncbi:MAG: hypothetical protein GY841_14575 [FCB group bacterium]|nr:hypothetical protein [FCB group bacterium]
MNYVPSGLRCIVSESRLVLPPEITVLRKRIKERERIKRIKGLAHLWNGPQYALEKYAISRTALDERPEVTFSLQLTDYYTFQATVMSLDQEWGQANVPMTLRKKYLEGSNIYQPIPFLANGFGIALTIISEDRKLVVTHRSEQCGARPGEIDVSVVESVHPGMDTSGPTAVPDLYSTAIRGLREEVGIDLDPNEIIFFGFGVDLQYYQWNLIGMARISQTGEEILNCFSRGVHGKWEAKMLELVCFDPKSTLHIFKKTKSWSTALVAAYWSLVNEYGKKETLSAADEVFNG